MSVFRVPVATDHEDEIAARAAHLHRAAAELENQHSALTRAGERATAAWTGEAAASFTAVLPEVLAATIRIADAHRLHAGLHQQYQHHVAAAKAASKIAVQQIQGHHDDYVDRSKRHLDDLIRRAQKHLHDALNELNKAGSDFMSGNLLGVGADLLGAVSDASQGLADLASALPAAITALTSWNPPGMQAALEPVQAVSDAVALTVLTDALVLDELASIGAGLASVMLDGISDVLALIGLDGAAAVARGIEHDFAAAASAAHRRATQDLHQLGDLGNRIARQIETDVEDRLRLVQTVGEYGIGIAGSLYSFNPFKRARLSDHDLLRLKAAAWLKYRSDKRRYQDDYEIGRAASNSDTSAGLPPYVHPVMDAPPPFDQSGNALLSNHGRATLYEVAEPGHPIRYVLGFKATDPGDSATVFEDGLDAMGFKTPHGQQAVALAVQLRNDPRFGENLGFAGWSLGGRDAAMASIATGRPATTYNSAGIGDGNYSAAMHAAGGAGNENSIINISVAHDGLTEAQRAGGGRIAAGAQIYFGDTTRDYADNPVLDTLSFTGNPIAVGAEGVGLLDQAVEAHSAQPNWNDPRESR